MSAPTWASVGVFTALALVCFSSASSDDPIEQREVTFDLRQHLRESDMLQRESDLSQILLSFNEEHNPGFSPRASLPHPVVEKYRVQFPLARPSHENIGSICLHGNRRPRYPSSYFPRSGFGVNKREADAVNTLEAWFVTCCTKNLTDETRLCCATQAWEKSISHFCQEGFKIKAPHFHCCKLNSSERLPCFHSSAENQDYNPTEESPVKPVHPKANFIFDPSTCPRVTTTSLQNLKDDKSEKDEEGEPSASHTINMNFPFAMPTQSNINSMCDKRKLRPHYDLKCLKGLGLELIAQQAQSIKVVERRFDSCCLKINEKLSCAQSAWRQVLEKFCAVTKRKNLAFPCCSNEVHYQCFEDLSTDRDYNKTIADNLSMDNVCNTHKMLTFKHLPRIPLKSMVDQCCHLTAVEKTACITQSVKELYTTTCAHKRFSPPHFRRCCLASSEECFNKVLMNGIIKATKRRTCPVS